MTNQEADLALWNTLGRKCDLQARKATYRMYMVNRNADLRAKEAAKRVCSAWELHLYGKQKQAIRRVEMCDYSLMYSFQDRNAAREGAQKRRQQDGNDVVDADYRVVEESQKAITHEKPVD